MYISFYPILNGKDKRNSKYALEATIVLLSTYKEDDDSLKNAGHNWIVHIIGRTLHYYFFT